MCTVTFDVGTQSLSRVIKVERSGPARIHIDDLEDPPARGHTCMSRGIPTRFMEMAGKYILAQRDLIGSGRLSLPDTESGAERG